MRHSDWERRLENYLLTVKGKPFTWGDHDCAMFACDCILIETGNDPAVSFRGKYNDEASAYAALKEFAGSGLMQTAEKICADLKYPEIPPAYAQRGDVAVCDTGAGDTLGIIDFTGRFVMIAAPVGIVKCDLSSIKRAWRVE